MVIFKKIIFYCIMFSNISSTIPLLLLNFGIFDCQTTLLFELNRF